MWLKKASIMVCLLLAVWVFGLSAETLTIKQYVKMALEHSPSVTISQTSVDASKASSIIARSKMIPDISGSASAGVSGTASSGVAPKSSLSAGLGASIKDFDVVATPLAYRISRMSVQVAASNQEKTRQATIFAARSAYYNYLLAQKVLAASQLAQSQAQLHLSAAQALFDVGKNTKVDIIKAQVVIANAQVSLIQNQGDVRLARIKMETVAGVAIADPLELADSLGGWENAIDADSALVLALKNSPDAQVAQLNLDIARLSRTLAVFAVTPSIKASTSFGSNATGSSSLEWSEPGWRLDAALTVPIFKGGALKASITKEDLNVQKMQATLDQTSQTIRATLLQNCLEENQLRLSIEAQLKVVESATESFRLSSERYRAGLANSLEMTDAELALTNAQKDFAKAQCALKIAHDNVLFVIGALNE